MSTLIVPLSLRQPVLFETPAELVETILPEERLTAKSCHRHAMVAGGAPGEGRALALVTGTARELRR
jgi:hypothetical protein